MAELDAKLLQNLDQTLKSMHTSLQNLENELKGVKSSMQATFNPSIVTEFSNAVRGAKISSLIDAEKSKSDIREIDNMVKILTQERKHGKEFTLFTEESYNKTLARLQNVRAQIDELNKKAKSSEGLTAEESMIREHLRATRDNLYASIRRGGTLGNELSSEQMNGVVNALARYKEVQSAINKGDQMRAAQLANLYQQETNTANEGTRLAQVRAEQNERAYSIAKSINREFDRQQKIQAAIESIESRGGKSTMFEKKKRSVSDLNELMAQSQQKIEKYNRELSGLGSRGESVQKAFGLNKVQQEVQQIPTVFDRVIAQINERAARSGEQFAKRLVNAQGVADEAKVAFAELRRQMPELAKYSWGDLQKMVTSGISNFLGLFTREAMGVKTGWDVKSLDAMRKYVDAIQEVERIQQRINILNDSKRSPFENQKRAIEGTTRRYNDNEQALAKLQARWEELNVKKQANLINDKDFQAASQNILNEYDRLIAKRKEFETVDLGQMSAKREQERAAATKKAEQERVQTARESNKVLVAERAITAQKKAQSGPELNAAVQKQLQYMQQIRKIGQDINALQANKHRSAEENALLAQRKKELQEILNKQRELNNEQKGSANLARQIFATKQYKQEIDKATSATKKHDKAVRQLTDSAGRLGQALAAAFGLNQIKRFVSEIVKVRGEFEMSEVALTNIIGNQEKSQLIWKKTMNLAVNSPFTAQQLTRATKQLAAFRIETDKLYDTTKMLGDVSVGLGVDIGRLILAYGHTKSSGFLRGMYARQFATAGVNIYGELADYYSDLEKRTVTFKEVYERIAKKMVTFADVEKVFEKITGEDGQFYRMQEVLSDTVQGQINKIKDSWQQAMNDIGKSQQGLLRNIVDIILNIIRNWRTWSSAIEGVTVAIIAFKATNITRALLSTSYAANAASKSTLRLAKGIKALGISFKANLPAMAIAAVVAAGTALVSAVKHMHDFNKEIDSSNTVLYDARQKMLGYQDSIEKNNETLKTTKKNSDEYKKAQEENIEILRKIKKEYPEIEEGLTIDANGYVVLTSKIEEHNRALEHQIYLNNLLKQSGIFDESVGTDFQDYQNELNEAVTKAKNRITNFKIGLTNKGVDISSLGGTIGEVFNIDWTNQEAGLREFNKILAENIDIMQEETSVQSFFDSDVYTQKTTQLKDEFKVLGRVIDFTNHAYKELAREFFNDEHEGFAQQSAQLYLRELNTQLLGVTDKEAKKEIEDWYDELGDDIAGIALKYGDKINDLVNKGIIEPNAVIKNVAINNLKAIDKESQASFNRNFRMALGQLSKNAELANLYEQLIAEKRKKFLWWSTADQSKIAALERQIENIIQPTLDVFAESKKKTGGGGEEGDGTGKQYKDFNALLDILKKMNSEYNKLSKSAYGYAKSTEEVRRSYKKAFDQILGSEAGNLVDWGTLDFTSKTGLKKAFEELQNNLNAKGLWGKYAKDVKKIQDQLEKEIGNQTVEIGIDAQVRIREDFGKQMEEAFGDYELTLELQKLNIPDDVAKDLFPDFSTETLGNLQARMNNYLKEQGANFDEDDLKKYEEWSKKVDAEILKSRKEKAKQMSKYLEKEYSERAKLQMKYAEDVAFVTANFKDKQQRDNILAGLNKKFNDDMSELNWKSFKESDFYVEMMEDLSSIPAEYAQMMLDKLNEILEHPETLSPRALKEAVNARQKIFDAQIATQPLKVMSASVKEIREASKELDGGGLIGTKKRVDEEIVAVQKEINEYDELIVRLQAVQGEMVGYENAVKKTEEAYGGLTDETKRMLAGSSAEQVINQLQAKFDENNAKIEEVNKEEAPNDEQKDLRARLTAENEHIAAQIKLVNNLATAWKEERIATQGLSEEAVQMFESGETSTTVGTKISNTQGKKDKASGRLTQLKDWQKSFLRFAESWESWNKDVSNAITKVSAMGGAFYDTFEALGGETDALTREWKEFGGTITQTITSALTLIPQLVVGFVSAGTSINAAMGLIGLIAEAIQLVLVLIQGLAKLHDAGYEKEIERLQEHIDELKNAYERLEKAIEKTYSTANYMRIYGEQVDNLREQISDLEAQRNAENQKKNSDKDKIKEYTKSIEEANDKIEELKQKQIEVFGGIGEVNYRSAAEEFVSAWKDAFLETGDGLEGLQDHFDEFLQDWFVKQATMRIAGSMLENVFNDIDRAVAKDSDGGVAVTIDELQAIRDKFAAVAPELSDALENLAGMFGFQGEGSLSGLAAGIQGITEEQANILEAYWNSVRMYTASIDSNVAMIANMLGVSGSTPNTNPMLQQMSLIAANAQATHQILESVTRSGHSLGGYGIKVFSN